MTDFSRQTTTLPAPGKRWLPLLLFGMLGLTACSTSPPVRLHTLVAPVSEPSPDTARSIIAIEAVSVPPQVDRSALVIRRSASELEVLESDWWGAPLPEEIRSALTTRLNQPGEADGPIHAWIEVTRFEAAPDANAWLNANIRLVNRTKDASPRQLSCHLQLYQTTGADVTSIVLAQQANLDNLTERLRRAADTLVAGDARCPD
ncbi:PqiC family protein [Marinobacter bohaiensis]|uniref:PqiC family protein n=1 Tax=Marinobacter bohaiensis TaxID=2201898 RepID=UPI000DAC401A|nr:ABC-type transport auxiliary lipoprotein family protein [Marinobacter bohaiensis]